MDPDEALRQIRGYIAQIRIEAPADLNDLATQHALDLAESVEALDTWISTTSPDISATIHPA